MGYYGIYIAFRSIYPANKKSNRMFEKVLTFIMASLDLIIQGIKSKKQRCRYISVH